MFLPVQKKVVLDGKDIAVRGGVADHVSIAAKQDVKILLKKGEEKKVSVTVKTPDRVWAPLNSWADRGRNCCILRWHCSEYRSCSCTQEVEKASWWKRWWPF